MVMRKRIVVMLTVIGCLIGPTYKAQAQLAIAEVIAGAVKKVIRAIDLKVQRLQNKTIWLQNAQKTLENEMAKLKLNEIKDWVDKQRKLYADYFEELWRVKAALATYSRVKGIIERQIQIIVEYKAAWSLFRQDKNLTPEELQAMFDTYTGMLAESNKNIEGLFLVVNSFSTQMSDGARLQLMNNVAEAIDGNLMDLKRFNEQNKMIVLQRAAAKGEIDYVRKLYGL